MLSLYGSRPTRSSNGVSVLRFLLVPLAIAAAAETAAEPRLARGTAELTLAGGYSVSQAIARTESGFTGFQLVPHLGVFVTDAEGPAWAPAWLRGRLELLAEPTVVHLDRRPSATSVGLSALGRWVVAGGRGLHWYVEAGPGVLTGETAPPQVRCDALFVLQAGAGVMLFWSDTNAITLGYRVQHVSNGGACKPNHGVNSAVVLVGLSTFFR